MIEPPRTDARIRLTRTPYVARLHTVVQHVPRGIALAGHQTPVGLAHIASLRTYPAQVATVATIVPDDSMRLQFPNHTEGLCPPVVGLSVYLACFVGTAIPAVTTVGTVKPHLKDVTILCQQLAQLVTEVRHIFRFAIILMVSVPWRQINGKFQSLLTAGLSQLTYHIAPTLLPRRVLHRILRIFRGPHAEAAVVLGGKDDALHACLLADTCPLATVQV